MRSRETQQGFNLSGYTIYKLTSQTKSGEKISVSSGGEIMVNEKEIKGCGFEPRVLSDGSVIYGVAGYESKEKGRKPEPENTYGESYSTGGSPMRVRQIMGR